MRGLDKSVSIVTSNKNGDATPDTSPLLGKKLKYDNGVLTSPVHQKYGGGYPVRDTNPKLYGKEGSAASMAKQYGIPSKVSGRQGCGCYEAHLHGIGEVVDGKLECDYLCDQGWHNYYVFDVRQKLKTKKPKKTIKLDKTGELETTKGHQVTELGEY